MNVLWVFAHPEKESLGGSLFDDGVRFLGETGHDCQVSDLYAMKWKATVDREDFTEEPDGRLMVAHASGRAYESGTLSADIRAEQEKLEWADTVVFQFPLWWYGMPAILKGWFDRVFVKGFGYLVPDPEVEGRFLRYGEGKLQGKRALVLITSGSSEESLGPRGINGELDQILFALLHGTLFYAGMEVLPPLVVYRADWCTPQQYDETMARLRDQLTRIDEMDPLPYRLESGGDYDHLDGALRPEVASGRSGLTVHYLD
ncbi:NAD(P)H-dependent oxidoreductase [Actinomadura fulvescens]|uniref:NAD(P)H-dependent oxidoreductase n=1 Tax=Actinomadura fulvescens TaxID=46160 RepID=A0ABN3PRN2_9ACTN